ncbi:MAG: EAL domain-containing protein [Bacillota bacterium]|nr:EAL domain-containing protein [Bacillota bacterium]
MISDQIWGFEALARFKSTDLGFVSPLEFIPLAEETKYINSIGDLIILEACDFVNDLKRAGYTKMKVAINISGIQLMSKEFTRRMLRLLQSKNVNPENVVIELTESILSIKFEKINKVLSELKVYGIGSSIDDFGTGYSSLSRERELIVDFLKIDKSFIDRLRFL